MRTRRLSSVVLLLLLVLAGCIPVPRGSNPLDMRFMSSEELREYSKKVFRHQNRITTRLMMAPVDSDAISNDQRSRVEQAEARMNEACASLNEIASALASDQDVDMELENEVRKTVRPCDREARRLEELLDELGIGSEHS